MTASPAWLDICIINWGLVHRLRKLLLILLWEFLRSFSPPPSILQLPTSTRMQGTCDSSHPSVKEKCKELNSNLEPRKRRRELRNGRSLPLELSNCHDSKFGTRSYIIFARHLVSWGIFCGVDLKVCPFNQLLVVLLQFQ